MKIKIKLWILNCNRKHVIICIHILLKCYNLLVLKEKIWVEYFLYIYKFHEVKNKYGEFSGEIAGECFVLTMHRHTYRLSKERGRGVVKNIPLKFKYIKIGVLLSQINHLHCKNMPCTSRCFCELIPFL